MTFTESCRSFGTLQLVATAKCTNGGSTIRFTRLGYFEAPFVETSASRYSAHRVTRRNTSTSTRHAAACSATSSSSSRPQSKSTGTKRGSSILHRYRFAASSAGGCDAANTHYTSKSRTLGVLLESRRKMLRIQSRDVDWTQHQILIRAENAKDNENRRIPFDPKGRLAPILKRRAELGPYAFVFGSTETLQFFQRRRVARD